MQGLLLFLALATSQINNGTASKALIKDYVAAQATLVGAPVAETLHIAEAESSFNTLAMGDYSTTTKRYTSFGMFQIHLPAHQDISQEQATDTVFATEWAVQQIKQGNGRIWSTYDPSLDVGPHSP